MGKGLIHDQGGEGIQAAGPGPEGYRRRITHGVAGEYSRQRPIALILQAKTMDINRSDGRIADITGAGG
jgi:hypothetical protein